MPGDLRASGGRSSPCKPSLSRGFPPFEKTMVMLTGRKENEYFTARDNLEFRSDS